MSQPLNKAEVSVRCNHCQRSGLFSSWKDLRHTPECPIARQIRSFEQVKVEMPVSVGYTPVTFDCAVESEQITHVAILYEGKVWALPRPNRHHHIIQAMFKETGRGIAGPDIQGFVTNTGRFLNRADAFILASRNGQLDRSWHPQNSYNGDRLYSEDLWRNPENRLENPLGPSYDPTI